ncbi:hypothetical protein PF008_g14476 [Phytophthora fragariae]|uniref:Uncharacterized protein n=1 Tax=Phytophthora fragariae TaxID=53985 RepID=A0A6G0RHS4_9STRA|nr:hypothetical protein PF008_g14476 [Phytophthora fragariae]
MSTTTASTFLTKLKQFNGTGFPAWGTQVMLVVEVKGLWDAVQQHTPTDVELKLERDVYVAGVGTSAASGTPSTPGTSPASPLHDRMLKQKMASSIILGALTEKLAAEVNLLENPLIMIRHLRMTYNGKCSASVGAAKREYIGLYLEGLVNDRIHQEDATRDR